MVEIKVLKRIELNVWGRVRAKFWWGMLFLFDFLHIYYIAEKCRKEYLKTTYSEEK